MKTLFNMLNRHANTFKILWGGYSRIMHRQNNSNLLSHELSLQGNYEAVSTKRRQRVDNESTTRRQRVEIKSITTAYIALTSPTHTLSYPIGASPANVFRRNRFFTRFTATLLLLFTISIGNAWASHAHHCLIGEPIATWKTISTTQYHGRRQQSPGSRRRKTAILYRTTTIIHRRRSTPWKQHVRHGTRRVQWSEQYKGEPYK